MAGDSGEGDSPACWSQAQQLRDPGCAYAASELRFHPVASSVTEQSMNPQQHDLYPQTGALSTFLGLSSGPTDFSTENFDIGQGSDAWRTQLAAIDASAGSPLCDTRIYSNRRGLGAFETVQTTDFSDVQGPNAILQQQGSSLGHYSSPHSPLAYNSNSQLKMQHQAQVIRGGSMVDVDQEPYNAKPGFVPDAYLDDISFKGINGELFSVRDVLDTGSEGLTGKLRDGEMKAFQDSPRQKISLILQCRDLPCLSEQRRVKGHSRARVLHTVAEVVKKFLSGRGYKVSLKLAASTSGSLHVDDSKIYIIALKHVSKAGWQIKLAVPIDHV